MSSTDKMSYTDDQLSALLDGELEPDLEQSIRDALATDRELAARFERLAYVDSLLDENYKKIDSEPLPQSVINLLAESDNGGEADRTSPSDTFDDETNEDLSYIDPVVGETYQAIDSEPLPQNLINLLAEPQDDSDIKRPMTVSRWPRMFTVAATLAFCTLGILLAFQLGDSAAHHQYQLATTPGAVPKDSRLSYVLSNARSASTLSLSGNASIRLTPVLSFKHVDGRYCREYLVQNTQSTGRSVACGNDDRWTIIAAETDYAPQSDSDYIPASSDARFDDRIEEMIDGAPLSVEEELALLVSGWQ